MNENVTATFDSLQLAQEASSKLQALRIAEVEVSSWSKQRTSRVEFADELFAGQTEAGGFVLNAEIPPEQKEKVLRIIRDCGGNSL